MYTGNVWGIALLIAGFLATLIGFELLLGAMFPRWAERAVVTLRERTVGSAFLGLGAVLVLIFGAVVLAQFGGPGKFASGLLVALGSFPLVGGLATVSRLVGERMPSPAGDGRPWRATLRGGVTCGLAFVTPLVGWFLILPASIVVGSGAVALSALSPVSAREAVPPLPAEAGATA